MKKLILDEVIERIKIHSHLRWRKDVAKTLGTNINTLSTWIQRGSIPEKYLAIYADTHHLSLDWLRKGIGEKSIEGVEHE